MVFSLQVVDTGSLSSTASDPKPPQPSPNKQVKDYSLNSPPPIDKLSLWQLVEGFSLQLFKCD